VRARAGGDRAYDLRPLLGDVTVEPDGSGGAALAMTTRIDPALGTGRPDDVLAALGERIGRPLEADAIVRERLVLADPRGAPVRDRPVSPNRRARR
jgi:hypothetical protein